MNINDISDWINTKAVLQQDLARQVHKNKTMLGKQEYFLEKLEESAELIRHIANKTQQQVKYQIEQAGTLMLESVFDENAPEVCVDFHTARNQTECVISFKRGDEKYSPMEESGFGASDIAGFGLRLAMWSLPAQKTSPVFIFDEAFKHLKGAEANKLALMAVKKMSEALGIQIIMISDERADLDDIKGNVDRLLKVEMVGGVSKMEVLK